MTSTLRKIEYRVIPGNTHHMQSPLRFSFLSSAPSLDIDPNPLFYQDQRGSLLGCNKSFEQLTGKLRHEIAGKATDDIFPPDAARILWLHFDQVVRDAGLKTFLLPLSTMTFPGVRLFLVTMAASKSYFCEPAVVSSLTDISGISAALPRNDVEIEKHQELLIRSEKTKCQVLEWISKLHDHLSSEGRAVLSGIVRHFKSELGDEVKLRTEQEFDTRHNGLYSALVKHHPTITKNEMRLCALLSLNHTPTEIAKLTGRSTNSTHVAFARIRSKLGFVNNHHLRMWMNASAVTDTNTVEPCA